MSGTALTKTEIMWYLALAVACLVLKAFFRAPDWVLFVVALTGGIVAWWCNERKKKRQIERENANRPNYVSPYSVSFDETGISSNHADGVVEKLSWSGISVIFIEVVDSLVSEPWWILLSKEGERCTFPISAKGQNDVVAEFEKRLIGYHNKATYREVGAAMMAMSGVFKVWSRESVQDV
jgi:hypothetical protein